VNPFGAPFALDARTVTLLDLVANLNRVTRTQMIGSTLISTLMLGYKLNSVLATSMLWICA
jgi:hypothetical protein